MSQGGLVSRISRFLKRKGKPVRYLRFQDPLGDFEMSYPEGWRYDRDIAVVDGKYLISFESREARYTINVDTEITEGFDFRRYAKEELESPESGIVAQMEKTRFRAYPAYRRDYRLCSGGKDLFGGDLMFFSGKAVFRISWSAPEKGRKGFQDIFDHMLGSLAIGEGFLIRMRRK